MGEPTLQLRQRYYLKHKLGAGQYSCVLKAEAKETSQECAVKIHKAQYTRLDSQLESEIRILKQLDHPNIVKVLDYQIDTTCADAQNFVALEYCPNGELFASIQADGGLPESVTRFYFLQLMSAIDYIHGKGFAHRDLKLENILLDYSFNLRLIDFEFATALINPANGSPNLTSALGTVGYAAPEIHMMVPYSGRSVDIFALGVILFIMATGAPPFAQATVQDNFYRYFCAKKENEFWNSHIGKQTAGRWWTEGDDFKSLVCAMLKKQPNERAPMFAIRDHPWLQGPVASSQEVQAEMSRRQQK